jgi:hypothetical protein
MFGVNSRATGAFSSARPETVFSESRRLAYLPDLPESRELAYLVMLKKLSSEVSVDSDINTCLRQFFSHASESSAYLISNKNPRFWTDTKRAPYYDVPGKFSLPFQYCFDFIFSIFHLFLLLFRSDFCIKNYELLQQKIYQEYGPFYELQIIIIYPVAQENPVAPELKNGGESSDGRGTPVPKRTPGPSSR